jgi:hypothetical protein
LLPSIELVVWRGDGQAPKHRGAFRFYGVRRLNERLEWDILVSENINKIS